MLSCFKLHRGWLGVLTTAITSFVMCLPAGAAADQTPAVAPALDPEAQQVLDRMGAAYQSLNTFSETIRFKSVASHNATPTELRTTLAYKKPSQISAVMIGGDKTLQAVSDGAHFYVAGSADRSRYLQLAVPPEGAVVLAVAQVAHVNLGLLPFLLTSKDTIEQLHRNLSTLTVSAPGNVDGTPVDILNGTLNAAPGVTSKITMYIGKTDHLLHQVVVRNTSADSKVDTMLTETHSNIRLNPPLNDSAFTFTPPVGAVAMTPTGTDARPNYDPQLAVGAAPIPFSAPDLNQKLINLSDYKGKVVLLDFWAAWCKPCWPWMPELIANYKNFNRKGFDIIGISLDYTEGRQELVKVLKTNDMTWPEVFDGRAWEGDVPLLYGVQALPLTILIGRDNKIIGVNLHGSALRDAIQQALTH